MASDTSPVVPYWTKRSIVAWVVFRIEKVVLPMVSELNSEGVRHWS